MRRSSQEKEVKTEDTLSKTTSIRRLDTEEHTDGIPDDTEHVQETTAVEIHG